MNTYTCLASIGPPLVVVQDLADQPQGPVFALAGSLPLSRDRTPALDGPGVVDSGVGRAGHAAHAGLSHTTSVRATEPRLLPPTVSCERVCQPLSSWWYRAES